MGKHNKVGDDWSLNVWTTYKVRLRVKLTQGVRAQVQS